MIQIFRKNNISKTISEYPIYTIKIYALYMTIKIIERMYIYFVNNLLFAQKNKKQNLNPSN